MHAHEHHRDAIHRQVQSCTPTMVSSAHDEGNLRMELGPRSQRFLPECSLVALADVARPRVVGDISLDDNLL